MTKKCSEDNGHVKISGYKIEADKRLIQEFDEACEYYMCSRAATIRQFMVEFVEDTKEKMKRAAEVEA